MSIPLLVGVVGHRNIPSEYVLDLEHEISSEIDKIKILYPNTSIAIVSSLAEGADRIGARVAVSKGIGLIVPLPLAVDQYEKDFPESVDEFRMLKNSSEHHFIVESSDFSGYEAASRWIASHCQLVIALWDGIESGAAPGGTEHTITLRLQAMRSGLSLGSIADLMGPVIHLHAPRELGVVRQAACWYWPDGSVKASIQKNEIFRPLDAFNRDTSLLSDEDIKNSLSQLHCDQTHSDPLVKAFACADALADKMQKKINRSLLLSVGFSVIGYVAQQCWANGIGRAIAGGLLVFAWCIVYEAKDKKINDRYLEYRALAEVLRISYFRRLAGLTSTPTDKFLNQHWGQLRWIRGAVNSLWVPSHMVEKNLDFVKSFWIDDQHLYYEKKSVQNLGRSNMLERIAAGVFLFNILLVFSGLSINHFVDATHLSGFLLILVGALSHYSNSRGWKDDGLRFSLMAVPFSWSQKIWASADNAVRQNLVNDLSAECISEISNWLLSHRTRTVEFMKA